MGEFDFTDDMDQISGVGGDYERACRAAVQTGSMWVALHPSEQPKVEGVTGGANDGPGVVFAANPSGESFLSTIRETAFTMESGRTLKLGDVLTSQQYLLVLTHIGMIAELGWNSYAAVMRREQTYIRREGKPDGLDS